MVKIIEKGIIGEIDDNSINDVYLSFLIDTALNRYIQYINTFLNELNLTIPQSRILFTLITYNNVSVDVLANKSYMSKSSVTKAVKHLESKGLVNKKIDDLDNRRKIVSITKEGMAMQEELLKLNDGIEERIVEKLGKEKIFSLKLNLKDLISELKHL